MLADWAYNPVFWIPAALVTAWGFCVWLWTVIELLTGRHPSQQPHPGRRGRRSRRPPKVKPWDRPPVHPADGKVCATCKAETGASVTHGKRIA